MVPRAILSQYVGFYETVSGTGTATMSRSFTITLTGDQLMVEMGGKGKMPLVPLSQTTFSPRLLGTYEFVKDGHGAVTHMMVYSTEGDIKAIRKIVLSHGNLKSPGKVESSGFDRLKHAVDP